MNGSTTDGSQFRDDNVFKTKKAKYNDLQEINAWQKMQCHVDDTTRALNAQFTLKYADIADEYLDNFELIWTYRMKPRHQQQLHYQQSLQQQQEQ